MQNLRINPLVAADLKEICNFIADNNEAYAVKTISEIYKKFEIIQHFPEIGAKLSERVSFSTDYRYLPWGDYVVIYRIRKEFIEILSVLNRYLGITRILD